MREREFIKLPVRCELAIHVKQGGATITCFNGLWFPAERGEDGINLGCCVRWQERQIFGVEGVEWRAYPTIGQPGVLVDGWGSTVCLPSAIRSQTRFPSMFHDRDAVISGP